MCIDVKITAEAILLNEETVVQIKYLIDGEPVDEKNIYILKLIKYLEERCCVCLKGGSEI